MKKAINIVLASGFTVSYATFLSLGLECSWIIFGILLANAAFGGKPMIEEYPRLVPFCVLAGLFALIAILVLVSLNVFVAKKLKNTKITWIIEAICTIILSLPMIKIWEIVFDYLRMYF